MVSYTIFYSLGIAVSLGNVLLWSIVLRSQLKQFSGNGMNRRIKTSLLIFGVASLLSNFVPIWFDVYQIIHHARPLNIGVVYITSQYLFRTLTACMFYLIYRV